MKKGNKRKKRKVNKPMYAFSLTLLLVMITGALGIVAFKLAPAASGEADQKDMPPEQERNAYIRQENISQGDTSWKDASQGNTSQGNTSLEDAPGKNVPGNSASGETAGAKETMAEPENVRYANELADAEYRKANRIYSWEAGSADEVTIGFVGDILLDDEYAIMANLLRRGVSIDNGISEAVLSMMQEVDIMVANNEFPYTNRGTPTEEKTFTFRADTAAVSYLHDMGIDAAVLANNHIYDFGEVGLLDTLDTLAAAGIPYVGAGRNLQEASAPVYYIINDIKIALVAATQIERLENPDTKGATQESAGVFRCLNPEKLCEVVRTAKENSDFVIVYIHWGTENVTEPDWAQLDQAPKIAEAGADLIIGDHPHCLQGITYYGNTPVIYSLGNFWFNSKTLDTGMVRVTVGQEGLRSFQFVPALQSDCRVDLVYGAEKERILSDMRELSSGVVIDQDGFVSRQ